MQDPDPLLASKIGAIIDYFEQEFPSSTIHHKRDEQSNHHEFTIAPSPGSEAHLVLVAHQFLEAPGTGDAIKQFLDQHGCAEKTRAAGNRPILIDTQGVHFAKRR